MKVLHLLVSGGVGGIENLIADYAERSEHENVFVFCWEGGAAAERISASGKKVIFLEKEKIGSKNLLLKLHNIFKEEMPTAVIVHHEAPLLWLFITYIAKKYPSVKTFCYAHCNARSMVRDNEKNLWLRKRICRFALCRCSKIIAISESVKKSITEYFSVPQNKITVVYNGVNCEKFLSHPKVKSEGLRLIYVGRLIRDKGVQGILSALSQIKNDKVTFTVVGDGDYGDELKHQAKQLEISDRVKFLGARYDVPQLLADADVFVHFPEWEEGFGIAVIEAMASGLICVCGKSGALSEIITHGTNGFLVEKGDISMLALQLKSLMEITDASKLDEIRTEALKTAQSFSVERFVQQLDKTLVE